jgi:hypothetical protein
LVTHTGTVSDFDRAGLFGLIIADDGGFVLFNLRETPPVLRNCFHVGTRVRFTKQAAEPTERAIDLAVIDPSGEDAVSSAINPKI